MENTELSASVVAHLSRYPFWTDEARAAISRDVGPAGLQLVQEAHQFAADQEDVWLHRPYEEAWRVAQIRLQARYPQFDTAAIECIARLAAYDWK